MMINIVSLTMPPSTSSYEMSYIVVVMTQCYAYAYLTKKLNESSTTLTVAHAAAMHLEWPLPRKSCVPDIFGPLSFMIASWLSSIVQIVKCFPRKCDNPQHPSTLSLQWAPSVNWPLISWNENQHLPERIIISSSLLITSQSGPKPCPPSTIQP